MKFPGWRHKRSKVDIEEKATEAARVKKGPETTLKKHREYRRTHNKLQAASRKENRGA